MSASYAAKAGGSDRMDTLKDEILVAMVPAVVFVFTLLASPVLLGELPFGWNTDAAAAVMHNDGWDAGGAL